MCSGVVSKFHLEEFLSTDVLKIIKRIVESDDYNIRSMFHGSTLESSCLLLHKDKGKAKA